MALKTILTDAYKKKYERVWPDRTLTDSLKDAVSKHPDKVAMIDRKSSYTYRAIAEAVDRVALGLIAHGLGQGDVISFQLPNWNEFLIIHYAATRIGAVSNPLIPIYRDREIGYMVKEAASKMLVGTTTDIMVERLSLTSRDVIFMASTFAHQTGYLYGVRMPIELGATAVFQDVWDPQRIWSITLSATK